MALAPVELSQVAAGTGGFVLNGAAGGDSAGRAVAAAGDVNGDGFDDILIGAPFADLAAGNNAGRAYVVFGRAAPFTSPIDLAAIAAGTGGFAIAGRAASDAAGWSVASAGDVNGDGRADLLVGAFSADPSGASLAGESYLVFGSASPPATINLATVAAGTGGFALTGAVAGDRSGYALAGAGDIDGDGLDDIVVGAFGAAAFAGRSYLVFGGATASIPLATVAGGGVGFALTGAGAGDRSGFAVAGIGDINGDGMADFAIGARYADTASSKDSGQTYVVYGATTRPAGNVSLATIASGTGGFTIIGAAAGDLSGQSIAAAGDINGDGIDDVVIGAPFAGTGYAGRSYVVFGRQGGFGAAINLADIALGSGGFVITGEAADDLAAIAAAGAGDVNADGFDDLIVGAHLHDLASRPDAGRSYVLLGHGGGFGASVALSSIAAGTGGFAINGQAKGDLAGFAVSAAGDVDGDGFADLLVGAYNATSPAGAAAGRSYVILGRDLTGTVTHPGTTKDDSLAGSLAANTMVGGQGADTIDGKGGADVLLGGVGNDTLRIADTSFRRIDGGGGTDTLVLDGRGLKLDLTTISRSRLSDIERIDLTGSGDNHLTLSARAITALSSSGNTLRVDGNAGDTLVFGPGPVVRGATTGGITRFTLGAATLDASAALSFVFGGVLSIARDSAFGPEGTGGTTPYSFTVTRTGSALGGASAKWTTSGGGVPGTLAASASDFAGAKLPSGTVTFADGQTSATITIDVAADATAEFNEGFTVTLSDLDGNVSLGTSKATGAILNDDFVLSIAAASAKLTEGTGGTTDFTFLVSRGGASNASHSVDWAVTGAKGPGTVPANAFDFDGNLLPSGTVTFAPLETLKPVTVTVAGDAIGELNERFAVTLANPTNGATIGTAAAEGLIYNDDTSFGFQSPTLRRVEGDSAANPFTFIVLRAGSTAGTATVNWNLTGGGVAGTVATNAEDFTFGKLLTGGIATFGPGQTSQQIIVSIAGDEAPETNESFTLTLSNPSPGVAITAATATAVIYDDDTIYGTTGNDTLVGTASADLFVLGSGQDSITGAGGRDIFRFLPSAIGPTNIFTFEDFSRAAGETFDLSRIDAAAGTAVNDPFSFIGTKAFSGTPGELRWTDTGTNRLVQGDTNGDATADLNLVIKAAGPIDAGWFTL